MRAIHTIVASSLIAAIAAGCEDTLPPASDSGLKADVIGSIERIDSDDLNSEWVGTEYLRIVDTDTRIVCESDWDLDGVQAQGETCDSCDVTLDVIRSLVNEIVDDCEVVMDTSVVVTRSRYLAYSNTKSSVDGNHGRVLVADQPEGPWVDYAGGALYDDRIVYHRSVYVSDDEFTVLPDDLRLRPLEEERQLVE